ncbi:MAG TPA: hypothetical protein VII58_05120 [Acidobacteriaceae bacterium]
MKEDAKSEKQSMKKKAAMAPEHRIATELPPDPIPAPADGSHERSHAAHLGEEHTRAKSEGNLQHGKQQGELRQPLGIEQHLQQRVSGRHK